MKLLELKTHKKNVKYFNNLQNKLMTQTLKKWTFW